MQGIAHDWLTKCTKGDKQVHIIPNALAELNAELHFVEEQAAVAKRDFEKKV